MWFEYILKFIWEYWKGSNEGFQTDCENGAKSEEYAVEIKEEMRALDAGIDRMIYLCNLAQNPLAYLLLDNFTEMYNERRELMSKYEFRELYGETA